MAAENVHQVTDSRVLAALAHPLRRRLMDVLKVHGPATVSVLAGHTGQSVANVSHHLRVLHTSGLVAQAPELAKDRRELFWAIIGARISSSLLADGGHRRAPALSCFSWSGVVLSGVEGRVRDVGGRWRCWVRRSGAAG